MSGVTALVDVIGCRRSVFGRPLISVLAVALVLAIPPVGLLVLIAIPPPSPLMLVLAPPPPFMLVLAIAPDVVLATPIHYPPSTIPSIPTRCNSPL